MVRPGPPPMAEYSVYPFMSPCLSACPSVSVYCSFALTCVASLFSICSLIELIDAIFSYQNNNNIENSQMHLPPSSDHTVDLTVTIYTSKYIKVLLDMET